VQGKTLDRLIARHGLRVNEALKYAVQMAAGLTKAPLGGDRASRLEAHQRHGD